VPHPLAYEVYGDPGVATELRIQIPGFMDDETALLCARTIAGWKPFDPGRFGSSSHVTITPRR
jgi:hypothetical protein